MSNIGRKREHSTDDYDDGVGDELKNSPGSSSQTVQNQDASQGKLDVHLPEILFNLDRIIEIDLHSLSVLHEIVGNRTDPIPVGFDMQWPSYGSNQKTALIQICVREPTEICLFLRVYDVSSLPDYLESFLSDPKIILVGQMIERNLKKLRKDFNLSDSFEVRAVDCCKMAKQVLTANRPNRWRLRDITAHVLKKKLVVNGVGSKKLVGPDTSQRRPRLLCLCQSIRMFAVVWSSD